MNGSKRKYASIIPCEPKRRKVIIRRLFSGVDKKTLSLCKNRLQHDIIEDIEEYEIEELYSKAKPYEENKTEFINEKHAKETLSLTVYQGSYKMETKHSGPVSDIEATSYGRGSTIKEKEINNYGDTLEGGMRATLIPSLSDTFFHEEGDDSRLGPKQKVPTLMLEYIVGEFDNSAIPEDDENTRYIKANTFAHRDYYGTREGPVENAPDKFQRNAFSQVGGRPNGYTFGFYEGIGFEGCGILDPFGLARIKQWKEFHRSTWLNGTFSYVEESGASFHDIADSSKRLKHVKTIERKMCDLNMDGKEKIRGIKMISSCREDAMLKLRCLTSQLCDYVTERAFIEKGLTQDNILIFRGDPQPKIVFLFRAPTYYDVRDAGDNFSPQLPRTPSSNKLGIIQRELHAAMRHQIQDCYNRLKQKGSGISINCMVDSLKHMLPLVTENCKVSGYDSGVAFLYVIPIQDPNNWGKTKNKKDNEKLGMGSGYRSNRDASEFPTNVMDTFMMYSQIALEILSPIVVVSTSEFTTRCLSANLESKMLSGNNRVVSYSKWYKTKLMSFSISAKSNSSKNTKKRKKGKTLISQDNRMNIQYVDPETGNVQRRRSQCWCIRMMHPFVVSKQISKYRDGVVRSCAMIASKIFEELNMMNFISGKETTVTKFFMNNTIANEKHRKQKAFMNAPGIQTIQVKKQYARHMILSGNGLMRPLFNKDDTKNQEKGKEDNIKCVLHINIDTCKTLSSFLLKRKNKDTKIKTVICVTEDNDGLQEHSKEKVSAIINCDIVELSGNVCVVPFSLRPTRQNKSLSSEEDDENNNQLDICNLKTFPSFLFNTKRWKIIIDNLVKDCCLYYGALLMDHLSTRTKKKHHVSMLIGTTKRKADSNYFSVLPRRHTEWDKETVHSCIKKLLSTGNKKSTKEKEKRIDSFFTLNNTKKKNNNVTQKNENENDAKKNSWISKRIHKGESPDNISFEHLFVPRLLMDITYGINIEYDNDESTMDYAMVISSVLEIIERSIFSEAHRITLQSKKDIITKRNINNKKAKKKKKNKKQQMFLTTGQVVSIVQKSHILRCRAVKQTGMCQEDTEIVWYQELYDIARCVKSNMEDIYKFIL